MAARGGLIGLNYACSFLSDRGVGSLDDLYRHVCRFLELGAGECLALGSDYDGTDIPPDLDSVETILGTTICNTPPPAGRPAPVRAPKARIQNC